MDTPITERFLAEVWGKRMLGVQLMTGEYGRSIELVYQGKKNNDEGPDFTDAVLRIDGTMIRGDIELHVNSSDWKAHGHQKNPRYNSIILHVVWNGGGSIALQDGRAVPTINIKPLLLGSLEQIKQQITKPHIGIEICYKVHKYLNNDQIGEMLDVMGEQRFHQKADHFSQCIAGGGEAQCLYDGIMTALGYAKNKMQFRTLASKVPLECVEKLQQDRQISDNIRSIERILLFAAGLDMGIHSYNTEEIDSIRSDRRMSSTDWRLFRVRPENHPVRRIAGMAHLLARTAQYGGLVNYVVSRVRESGLNTRLLENRFIIRAAGPSYNAGNVLIGRNRSREIIINIILPFIYAWARYFHDGDLKQQALSLYRKCRNTHDYGLTKEVQDILIPNLRETKITARRQQGLLHLVKNFCLKRQCTSQCPIYKRIRIMRLRTTHESSQKKLHLHEQALEHSYVIIH